MPNRSRARTFARSGNRYSGSRSGGGSSTYINPEYVSEEDTPDIDPFISPTGFLGIPGFLRKITGRQSTADLLNTAIQQQRILGHLQTKQEIERFKALDPMERKRVLDIMKATQEEETRQAGPREKARKQAEIDVISGEGEKQLEKQFPALINTLAASKGLNPSISNQVMEMAFAPSGTYKTTDIVRYLNSVLGSKALQEGIPSAMSRTSEDILSGKYLNTPEGKDVLEAIARNKANVAVSPGNTVFGPTETFRGSRIINVPTKVSVETGKMTPDLNNPGKLIKEFKDTYINIPTETFGERHPRGFSQSDLEEAGRIPAPIAPQAISSPAPSADLPGGVSPSTNRPAGDNSKTKSDGTLAVTPLDIPAGGAPKKFNVRDFLPLAPGDNFLIDKVLKPAAKNIKSNNSLNFLRAPGDLIDSAIGSPVKNYFRDFGNLMWDTGKGLVKGFQRSDDTRLRTPIPDYPFPIDSSTSTNSNSRIDIINKILDIFKKSKKKVDETQKILNPSYISPDEED